MIMNAVLAVALGLAPTSPTEATQTFRYDARDYAGLIGRYSQSTDGRGTTHLRGFDRLTGKPFDLAVAEDGRVEGSVGDNVVTFTISEAA
jgi:hypothetical protein